MWENLISKEFFYFFMAVPKKKMSKSRRNSRRSYWKKKVVKNVVKAISLGKSIINGTPNSFVLDKSIIDKFFEKPFLAGYWYINCFTETLNNQENSTTNPQEIG